MTLDFMVRLEQDAVAANQREQDFRRQAAAEISRLETDRAYIHRRLHAMKDMVRVARSCETSEEATKAQLIYVFKDIGWIGDGLDDLDDGRKEVADRLAPVAEAIHSAVSSQGGAHADPVDLFHTFEMWFYETYGKRFLDAYETYVDEFMYPDA